MRFRHFSAHVFMVSRDAKRSAFYHTEETRSASRRG